MSAERQQPGTPSGQGTPPPARPAAQRLPDLAGHDLAGSGELVLTEEVPGAAAPARDRPTRAGWRVGEDDEEVGPEPGELSDQALGADEEPAAPDPDPPGPEVGVLLEASPDASSDAAVDVASSGEGPLLLDASPDDESARPVPAAPPPPLDPAPARPPAGASAPPPAASTPPPVARSLSRSTPALPLQRPVPPGALSRSTPSTPHLAPGAGGPGGKISKRLGEFYGGAEGGETPRRPSRRFEPVCRVCGSRLEGTRCGRCGESTAPGAAALPAPAPDPLARSTPRGSLSAAVRDRLERESEQRAALAATADGVRRRGDRAAMLAGALTLAALGAPVSALVGPAWLVGLFLLLDGALGAWAGRRIARADAALVGQVAAGGAMGAGVAVKLLVAALHSDVHLLLALGAALGACLLAALLGGLLAVWSARGRGPRA